MYRSRLTIPFSWALMLALLVVFLPLAGCVGPEKVSHQPVSGVDQPHGDQPDAGGK